MQLYEKAIREWRSLLGDQSLFVIQRNKYYSIILKPSSKKDVKQCLKIAVKHNTPLQIESQGKNYGYTHHNASFHTTILSLHKLNAITSFDENLAYITVQPGVTFQQVYEYLQRQKSNLMISMTGGPVDGSVLATTMERGIGKGRYGDRFEHFCDLEVLLPSGKIIHTGLSRFQNSVSKQVAQRGFGPVLDGLFSQSSLGIVLGMTIWLHPKPKNYSLCTFIVHRKKDLPAFINAVRILKLQGLLPGNFLLANPYRLLCSREQYPWKEVDNQTPLPQWKLEELMKKHDVRGFWMGQSLVSSSDVEHDHIQRKLIEKHFNKSICSIEWLGKKEVDSLKRSLKYFSKQLPSSIKKKINENIQVYEQTVFLGIPSGERLGSLRWRARNTSCGTGNSEQTNLSSALWVNGVIPMSGDIVEDVVLRVSNILTMYAFEPNIGLNFVTDRVVYLIGVILFDQTIDDESKRAIDCYHKINTTLAQLGVYPYRLSPSGYEDMTPEKQSYKELMTGLKKLFDPQNILR